jgi:hypothetical protein
MALKVLMFVSNSQQGNLMEFCMSSEKNCSATAATGWLEIKWCFSAAVLRYMAS